MKILIVDDEPGVARRLADGVGEAAVGKCFAAENAGEAIAIVNRESGIDLLVTDVFMDGIDGFTLHETIRPHLPELRTIFLSEYDIPNETSRADGWPVIAKPVEAGALADFIQNFCSANGASQPKDTAAPQDAPVLADAADSLAGKTLGDYRIESFLGFDRNGSFYHAVQTNIDRAVELHALDSERAGTPSEVERFLTDARTKANVHHPALLSVFEAGQHEGVYYYTSEVRNGYSLATLAEEGTQLNARVIFQLLRSVAEVMVHLGHEKIAHEPLRAEHVLVDHRMRTRLVNTAVSQPSGRSAVQEMQSLSAMVSRVRAPSESSRILDQLLFDMESESVALRSWNALLFEAKRCASGTPTPHVPKLDASGRAAIEAVGAARKRQRRTRRMVMLAAIFIPLCAGGYWAWKTKTFLQNPVVFAQAPAPGQAAMVEIPAGEIVFNGQKVMIPDFWMDVHEVSIGQYATFLAWLGEHPGEAAGFMEDVPAAHSFVPKGWADTKSENGEISPGSYTAASNGGTYEGAKLTLDSPVFGVDWFDARAFAKWKGHRLPTPQEWEKAALGAEGKKYPWGDEWKPGYANIVEGDEFEKWSPVDATARDQSPYGAIGMAGNVSEWTAAINRAADGSAQAVVRGGNWSDAALDMHRAQNLDASQSAPTVGFRTVSDKPPTP